MICRVSLCVGLHFIIFFSPFIPGCKREESRALACNLCDGKSQWVWLGHSNYNRGQDEQLSVKWNEEQISFGPTSPHCASASFSCTYRKLDSRQKYPMNQNILPSSCLSPQGVEPAWLMRGLFCVDGVLVPFCFFERGGQVRIIDLLYPTRMRVPCTSVQLVVHYLP